MGMLDLKTGEFIYVNGGHNAPLMSRENKSESPEMSVISDW